MKAIYSTIFRALCSIAVGILLLKYPESTLTWLTRLIGVLFFLPGIYSVLTYFIGRKQEAVITDSEGNILMSARPSFPLVGIGSVLFGLTLALLPSLFVKYLMYVLGGLLTLAAINTFILLIRSGKYFKIGFGNYIAPSLILITGLFVILYPMESASIPFIIIGWCCLFYGVTECILAIMITRANKQLSRMALSNKPLDEPEEARQ